MRRPGTKPNANHLNSLKFFVYWVSPYPQAYPQREKAAFTLVCLECAMFDAVKSYFWRGRKSEVI